MALPFVFVSVPEHLVPIELPLTIATSLVIVAAVIVVIAVTLAFPGMARAVVAADVPIWQDAGTQADPLRTLLGIINEAFIARPKVPEALSCTQAAFLVPGCHEPDFPQLP